MHYVPPLPCVQLTHVCQSYDFLLSHDGSSVSEDLNPTSKKILPVADGYILQNVSGIRAHIVSRMDGQGYDVTKCEHQFARCCANMLISPLVGPYSVKTGQMVYVNDSNLLLAPLDGQGPLDGESKKRRSHEVELRLLVDLLNIPDVAFELHHDVPTEAIVMASTATFGADPGNVKDPLRFGRGDGVRVVYDPTNPYGCNPYKEQYTDDVAVVVKRGDCTFLDKLLEAAMAGASGVITLSDEEFPITPSADAQDMRLVGDQLNDVAIVVVSRDDGELITAMLNAADTVGGEVKVVVTPTTHATLGGSTAGLQPEEVMQKARDNGRVLYLNGHPLINTRLMV